MNYQVIKRPLISEKNAMASEQANTYAFEVDRRASKTDIKAAIEKVFNVKVDGVRTQICRGQAKRRVSGAVAAKHWKKALVKLKAGEKISIFEGA